MKVLIGAIVFAIAATAALLAASRMSRIKDQGGLRAETGATQDLTAFADFDGPYAVRRDGVRVAFLAIEGKRFKFMTPAQKDAAAAELEQAFAATDRPFTIHRTTKPEDPSAMLRRTQEEIERAKTTAQQAQEQMLREAAGKGRGGEAGRKAKRRVRAAEARRALLAEVYEPRARAVAQTYRIATYVTMAFPASKTVSYEAHKATCAFAQRLAEAGYEVRLMQPSEIIEALSNYYGRYPTEAQIRRAQLQGGR